MLIVWIFLWLIAAILIFSDPKSMTIRWGSAVAFFSGCGGLAVVIRSQFRSYVVYTYQPSFSTLQLIDTSANLCSSFAHYIAPFCLFVFSLLYTESLTSAGIKKWLVISLLSVPVIMMYIAFPVVNHSNLIYTTAWVAPYVMASNLLLIYAATREQQIVVKRQRTLTCLFVCPTTLFSLISNYVLIAAGFDNTWKYNTWMVALGFISFIYFSIRYGFLGIQLRFEKQRFDLAMKAAVSGTALLNHTIKNEAGKIHILAERISFKTSESANMVINEVELIQHSAQQMMDMASRIQQKIQMVVIKENPVNLIDCLEAVLRHERMTLEPMNIRIERRYAVDVLLKGDHVHLNELFSNLIHNAVEAMYPEGLLIIRCNRTSRHIHVDFTDNGKGISRERLPYVLDPFYSTKSNSENYGLGLSYGYNVMQKHDGQLLIESEENRGTKVTLTFPMKRVIKIAERSLLTEQSEAMKGHYQLSKSKGGNDVNQVTVG